MPEEAGTQLLLGMPVVCRDGTRAELRRVLLTAATPAITELAVARHRRDDGRLVPIGLVESVTDVVTLSCTADELDRLDTAVQLELPSEAIGREPAPLPDLPAPAPGFEFSFLGGPGASGGALFGMSGLAHPQPVKEDRLGDDEVELDKGEQVYASDGPVGHVRGVAADAEHRVTHILLAEGHLWGEKEVAIPIGAVKRLDGEVAVTLSKEQIRDLPRR